MDPEERTGVLRLSEKWTPSLWNRKHRPELDYSGARGPILQIVNDLSPRVVIKKGVQVGATEIATTRACHFIDTFRDDVLFLFPTGGVAGEFSSGRFEPMLERNPYLRGLFTDTYNVHHKRAGAVNLYVRGSNSEAQLISVPIRLLIIDEFDRMDLNNLGLARDRLSGRKDPMEMNISTPTLPGMGIDAEYQKSDQRRLLLECPSCKERLPLSFASLDIKEGYPPTGTWRCSACGMPWEEEQKQELVSRSNWVPAAPERQVRGYHLPGLYSTIRTADQFAARWMDCRANETQMQIFHNSVLGEAFSPEGTRVTDEMLYAAKNRDGATYRSMSPSEAEAAKIDGVCMGIDVGAVQHFVIAQPEGQKLRVLRAGSVPKIRDLPALVKAYNIRSVVIDANPERQMAREFQAEMNRLRYRAVYLAFYPEMKGPIRWDHSTGVVDLHRTEALDTVVGRFRNGTISLPLDISEEFSLHLRAIVRVNEIDKRTGNAVGRWRESGPDHLAHALVYCDTAALRVGTAESRLGVYVM